MKRNRIILIGFLLVLFFVISFVIVNRNIKLNKQLNYTILLLSSARSHLSNATTDCDVWKGKRSTGQEVFVWDDVFQSDLERCPFYGSFLRSRPIDKRIPLDSWGGMLRVLEMKNKSGNPFKLISCGPNGLYENGDGDDIVCPDMSNDSKRQP